MEPKYQRKIRSFVKREGRLTPAQSRAMDILMPQYGLTELSQLFDWKEIFKNENPICLEIGFGMGHSLAQMAQAAPNTNFIGIEVHTPGVGTLLNEIEKMNLSNVRVIQADAVEVLDNCIANHSLDRLNLFFPDPWHKARHHKRRLIQTEFIDKVAQKLTKGGRFHLATDWQPYAEHMMEVFSESSLYANAYGQGQYTPDRLDRPETKFERRGIKLGHGVWDMVFKTV